MSDDIHPIDFTWKVGLDVVGALGEITRGVNAMVPREGAPATQAKRQYEADGNYSLVPEEERNMPAHRAQFAELREYWLNIPEAIQARWLNQRHFRYWCLIETGWYNESEIQCASEQRATEAAALLKTFDVYARLSVHGNKLIIRRAKSQKVRKMRKRDFEKSMRDVLDLAATFVGVSPAQMTRHARAL